MATWTAATGNAPDVQTAINSSSNGDTVVIPNGSYTWTQQVNNNSKAITLKAATVTSAANLGPRPTTSPSVVTTPPSVTITWTGSNASTWAPALYATDSTAGNFRIAGIKFQGPVGINGTFIQTVPTGGLPIIIQDCAFNIDDGSNSQSSAITFNAPGGVLSNCWFNGGSVGRQGGCCKMYSTVPWYNPSTFGVLDTTGTQNTYFEQCQFDYLWAQGVDADDQTRVVIRNSIINNCNFLTHGITSTWGGRQVEIYNSTFQYFMSGGSYAGSCPNPPAQWPNVNRYFWMRAGTARIWGNSVQPIFSNPTYYAYRQAWSFVDEPLFRPGSGNGGVCETNSEYPGTRWPGTGSKFDGSESHPSGVIVSPSTVDPVYIWNNVDAAGSTSGAPTGASTSWNTTPNDPYTGTNCPDGSTTGAFLNQNSAFNFQLNRDIFFSAPPTTATTSEPAGSSNATGSLSNYAPFVYPHPLLSTSLGHPASGSLTVTGYANPTYTQGAGHPAPGTLVVTSSAFARVSAEINGFSVFQSTGRARGRYHGNVAPGTFVVTSSAFARVSDEIKAISKMSVTGSNAGLEHMHPAPGTFSVTSSANGHEKQRSSASGSIVITLTGSASHQIDESHAPGTFSVTSAAFARVADEGKATGTLSVTSSALSRVIHETSALGTFSVTGSTPGHQSERSLAPGTLSVTGTATGHETQNSSATGAVTFTGVAHPRYNLAIDVPATGTFTVTGQAGGTQKRGGSAPGTITFSGSSLSRVAWEKQATGTITISSSANSHQTEESHAAGTLTITGVSIGRYGQDAGSASGHIAFSGAAFARVTNESSAPGTILFSGVALSRANKEGKGSGTLAITGGAIARLGAGAPGFFTVTGRATSEMSAIGAAVGTLTVTSSAHVSTTGFFGVDPVNLRFYRGQETRRFRVNRS